MGKQSRSKRERRNEQIGREILNDFLSNAQPLIDAASQDGPLTVDQLQRVLDEALERDHLRAFSAMGPQRDACLTLLVEASSSLGNDLKATKAAFAQIDPDSKEGTTPVAMMAVAAENLDRWLGPRNAAAPLDVRTASGTLGPGLAEEDGDHGEATAYEAVFQAARSGGCSAVLPQLLTFFGGELLMATLVAVVGEVSAIWSAAEGEFHDTHLRNKLR